MIAALHINTAEAKGELRVSIVIHPQRDEVALADLLDNGLTDAHWAHPKLSFTSVPSWCLPTIEKMLITRGRTAEAARRRSALSIRCASAWTSG